MGANAKTIEELQAELEELRYQLTEANETLEAIRTGQVDALVVEGSSGHRLYTLKSADVAYRVFIEKMTEGAVTLNQEGAILYCNSQFASMVNQPLSQVIGLPFETFIAPEKREAYKVIFQKCWTTDYKGEVELNAGAHKIPVQLSLTALKLEDDVSLSMILTDLTAQKQTQLQLEQKNQQLADSNNALELSNHDLQQFASIASHDLQEPLRKIQIFSNLLKERHYPPLAGDSKLYVDKIIESAGRMKTLILDVLQYSKLSASNKGWDCVELNDVVNELLDDFELVIHEKDARITAADLPCIYVNRGQIRQVFQNIISNAIKFSKGDTTPVIAIDAKRLRTKAFDSAEQKDGPFCLITIADNGIGFDEKYVSNIFALFERLHSKDAYEGTGIGLAITKKIIDKHNGLITAQSEEGKGAVFKIILPVNPSIPDTA